MVLDHGKVVYAEIEKEKGVHVSQLALAFHFGLSSTADTESCMQVSGVDAVLAHL